ncbi:MAG: divalent metal cation transporter [Candidatus Binatia bacterium]|nr:divalent metal cation transporter [Candidatus Binatia bacterium]
MSDSGRLQGEDLDAVRAGLRLAHPPDPAQLENERARLAAADAAPLGQRLRVYGSMVGPGYMQSAMTLGGGTATAALFSGAVFGYALLWVAPVAMLFGVVMLSAVAHQTLSTGMRPLEAMRRYAGTPFAAVWALGALFSSVIWHFSHYALASAVVVDLADVAGVSGVRPLCAGVLILVWAIGLSLMYGTSYRLVRIYERILKYIVWGVILSFGLVVARTGISDVGALVRGFTAFEFPADRNGVAAATLVASTFAAAVGINMLFLYPYSLLARGWTREHRGLARFDLGAGMLVPYTIAASLITIAAANTILLDPGYDGTRLSPVQAAQTLGAVIGPEIGRVVFGLGILGMALSSMTLHMLVSGFVCAEVFGWEFGGTKYKLATLIPAPGILGCLYWSDIAVWVAVPTNIVCGLFLPLAYLGFIRLQRNRNYLGNDTPSGTTANLWLAAMSLTTLFLAAFYGWYLVSKGPGYLQTLLGGPGA